MSIRVVRSLGAALLVLSFAVLWNVVSASAAISSHDKEEIAALRSAFDLSAGDEELARLLDAPRLGPSIEMEAACVFEGEHALDPTAAEAAEVQAILSYYESTLSSDAVLEQIALAALGGGFAAESVIGLRDALAELDGAISTFVGSEAYLDSDAAYREWLSQYFGNEFQDGQTPEEARDEVEETAGSALDAITQPRHLTRDDLFAMYEAESQCMRVDQDPATRQAHGDYIDAIAETVKEYGAGHGLILVPVGADSLVAINDGDGVLEEIQALDASGDELGELADLGAGQSAVLSLDGAPPSEVRELKLTVDEVPEVNMDTTTTETDLYVGEPSAKVAPAPTKTVEFGIAPGPFAAYGKTTTYGWSFDAGGSASGSDVTHTFACYGQQYATFTASIPGSSPVTRRTGIDVPAPFDVDFNSSDGELAVAPEVPITLEADPSIPTSDTVSWSFGDGYSATGRAVTHTYTTANIETVTMYVSQPGGCSSLSESHSVAVGRSDQWIPLYGTIPGQTLKSTVAGYVVNGPVVVPKGQTLRVRPGTNVKFTRAAGEPGQLQINGRLDVEGSAAAPAVFTSRFDDSAGGRCSCGGSESPAAGDWYGISLFFGGEADIEHAEVRYANHDLDLQGQGQKLSVIDSVLSDAGAGVYSNGPSSISVIGSEIARDGDGARIDCFDCTTVPRFAGDTFDSDQSGAWVTGNASPEFAGDTFTDLDEAVVLESTALRTSVSDSTVTSGDGYVHLEDGWTPGGSVRLRSDLPYLLGGELQVSAASQLVLPAGTVFKFFDLGNAGDLSLEPGSFRVKGSLVALGDETSPVLLTASAGTPEAGDWGGIVTEGEGSAALSRTTVRYAETGLEATSDGRTEVHGSHFSDDGTGVEVACSTCASPTMIEDTDFERDGTGVLVADAAAPVVHSSNFAAGVTHGVDNRGSATVDATGNWWAASSGPKPGGAGATVSERVDFEPFCTGLGECVAVGLSAGRPTLTANGEDQVTLTATVSGASGPLTGQHIYFTTDMTGQVLGPVVDVGDGTYTTTVTSSRTPGEATLTAIDTSLVDPPRATLGILQQAPTVTLELSPESIQADGVSTTTARATVDGVAGPLSGEPVTIESDDPGETVGPVVEEGAGLYTATITASETLGSATITSSDSSSEPAADATATLEQVAPRGEAGTSRPTDPTPSIPPPASEESPGPAPLPSSGNGSPPPPASNEAQPLPASPARGAAPRHRLKAAIKKCETLPRKSRRGPCVAKAKKRFKVWV